MRYTGLSFIVGGIVRLLPLLALLIVVAVGAVVAVAGCPPGSYEYNASGQFVCVPAVSNYSLPYASVSAYYAEPGVLELRLA